MINQGIAASRADVGTLVHFALKDLCLLDTVRAVEQLRRDDRTVLIHCVQAQSRTPTVATLYGARLRGIGITEALAKAKQFLSG